MVRNITVNEAWNMIYYEESAEQWREQKGVTSRIA